MKIRLIFGLFLGLMIACGPTKEQQAQKLARINTTMQQMNSALASGAQGASRDAGAGTLAGTCPQGGTFSGSWAAAGAQTAPGTASAAITFTTTFTNCKANGNTLDNSSNGMKPLTYTGAASVSGLTGSTGGTGGLGNLNLSGSVGWAATYDGDLQVTGKESFKMKASALNITTAVSLSLAGGAGSAKLETVVDGTAELDGLRTTFTKESFKLDASIATP